MHKYLALTLLIGFIFSQDAQVSKKLSNLSSIELEKLKNELDKNIKTESNQETLKENDKTEESDIGEIELKSLKTFKNDEKYFGYDYFNRDLNFFDNILSPPNFKLGPGDKIIISLWGEVNQREIYQIDKNGSIFFESVGFINLSNLTISETEILLKEQLSKVYSTIDDKNNPTSLKVDLEQIKSINVFFSGQVFSPGINIIHPFSDIYSALIQAGGVKDNGSLRRIQLIRNGETINEIDLYSFFLSGREEFQNIRLTDGDIIHVPFVEKRVFIGGEVNVPKFYEVLSSESLTQIVEFAGGTTSSSSNKALVNNIIPREQRLSDDIVKDEFIVDLLSNQNVQLFDGSAITVLPISPKILPVSIFGRVKFPGDYPLRVKLNDEGASINRNINLKELLLLAGGFEDPDFRKSIEDNIQVLRLDDQTKYGQILNSNFNQSSSLTLMPGDKVFVYENPNYLSSNIYSISGEVKRPGTYALKPGDSISSAVEAASGFSENGSFDRLKVFLEIETVLDDGTISTKSERILNASKNTQIIPNMNIVLLSKTETFSVLGNVYNPGLISLPPKSINLRKAIELAGGLKKNTLKKNIYVERANGSIVKTGFFKPIKIYSDDTVFIPEDLEPNDFDFTSFIADLSQTLANIVAILLIIDNSST